MPKSTPIINASEPHARQCLIESVRQFAKDNGITQKMIAERSGLKQANISRVLTGKYSPTLDVFLKITKAVGLDVRVH